MMEQVTDALATYRIVRLVQRDTLPPVVTVRAGARRWTVDKPALGELLECPWCLSFWVGLLVVVARRCAPRAWQPVAFALAASAVAGFLSELEEKE